jgi:hypothetical protein
VLFSPSIAATTLEPDTVPSTIPYVDGTTGFRDELTSARSILSAQSNAPEDSGQTTTSAESGYPRTKSKSLAARADGSTPDQAVSDQPSAQTPDRSVFSSAVKQSVIGGALSSATTASPSMLDKATPRARGNRLPSQEDARGNRSSQNESKTPAAPGPKLPNAPPSIVAATLLPAVPAGTSLGSFEPLGSDTSVNKGARRVSSFTDSRADAPSNDEPPAEDAVAPAAATDSAASNAVTGAPQALAFAVRVQPGRPAPLPSRDSAVQQVSDNSPVASAEGASSRTHAPRQTSGSDADPGESLADEAAPKDAQKGKAGSEETAQSPSMTNGSMPIGSSSANSEASTQSAANAGQPRSQLSDPTAGTAEPPALSQTTQPQGPMKELSMRIEAAEGQKVDVRIVQRAGDVQIAVKSADDVTTQGLRHGLSDLANRLNETGYRAETWRPGQQAAPESSPGSSENPSHQSQSGGSQSDGSRSYSGGPQQDRGQHHNNPSNRPHWIDELESNLSAKAEPTGQFNGIVSQPTI